MSAKPTRETLARDRERRESRAQELARRYRAAANELKAADAGFFYDVIRHLRDEASRWER